MIRVDLQRPLEAARGAALVVQRDMHLPEVIVRARIGRIDLDGTLQQAKRFMGIAGLLCDQAQIVERGGLIGILCQNPTIDSGGKRQIAPLVAIDVAALLQALDRYPYGCTEQTVSRAMPLLYVNQLASAERLGLDPDIDGRIKTAIERVLSRQSSDGSFGLWSQDSSDDIWLDAINHLLNAKNVFRNLDDRPSHPSECVRISLIPSHLKPLMGNEFKGFVGIQLQTAFLAVLVYDERLGLGINGQLHRFLTFLEDG